MTERSGFLWRHLAPVLPLATALIGLEWTSLDSTVSSWFFDAVKGEFPLRYNQLLEVVGHQWAKEVVIVIACGVIAMYLLSFLLPELRQRRQVLLYLSLALTLAPLAVTLLKAVSSRQCPWNLQEFGGFAPHLPLFASAPEGLAAGHCFPSGHASAGFCLLAFYFAGYAIGNRRLALAGLCIGLTAGAALGATRIAQGAHFLSHNLWSAVVCWLVVMAVYVGVFGLPGKAATHSSAVEAPRQPAS